MTDKPRDTVVSLVPIPSGGFLVVTADGKMYRISWDCKDLEKLWIEVPVND